MTAKKSAKEKAAPRKAPRKAARKPAIAETVLAATPVGSPDAPLTDEQEKFITEYLRNGQNGTAAWLAVNPKCTPAAAAVTASRTLRLAKVRDRITAERERLAKKHDFDRDRLFAELVMLATADPAELSQMRQVSCGMCWPDEKDAASPIWQEPNPDCERCSGEGFARPWFGDVRKVSPAARRLFSAVHVTKEGMKVVTRDQDGALDKIAKILGAYEKDNAQKVTPLAEALQGFLRQLHSSGVAKLTPVAPASRLRGST